MKIAHLNLQDYIYFGIEKKLIEQAMSAKSLGLDIDYIILNNEKEYQQDNIIYKKLKYPQNNFVKKIMRRFFKFTLINNTIDLDKYDAIVIRYPRPISYDWKRFTNRYPKKIITEHHAIALHETIIKITFGNILNYIQELFNSRRFKNYVIGLIGVTTEITKEEAKKNSYLRTKTISNGINVSGVAFTQFIPFDNKSITMTMVASEYASWHGLDKLLRALFDYDTELMITLNIVGDKISNEDQVLIQTINTMKDNIHIHLLGIKKGEELDDIFSASTLAIGSLAMYRKKMQEACALKVREYLARGIPFVYSAKDPDIPENACFVLHVPNDDSSIQMDEIIKFANNISAYKHISQEMREYALNHVDWKIKVQQMYDFVENMKLEGKSKD